MNSVRKIVERETDKKYTKCKSGWVVTQRLIGDRYYVTATGYKARTVTAHELFGYVRELTQALGGKAV